MSNTSPHTRQQLQQGVKDFCYLINQTSVFFVWHNLPGPKRFSEHLHPDESGLIENCLVESMLLSIRVLNEFFSENNQREGDVRAVHFGFKGRPFLSAAEKDDIDKRLAHMTTRRGSNEHWPLSLTKKALIASKEFLVYLESEKGKQYQPSGFDLEFKDACAFFIDRL